MGVGGAQEMSLARLLSSSTWGNLFQSAFALARGELEGGLGGGYFALTAGTSALRTVTASLPSTT